MPSFSPGSIFAERYRIVRPIASGGMGAVYEAKHVVTGRRCAVKVMLGHALDKADLRARFLHEARLAARIRSAYIVDILDAGIENELDLPYLVMELLEGEDLAQRLVRRGPLAPTDAVSCLWHVAIALDKMHRAGVIHRDLKPRNLFVTRADDGTPLFKVVDFGVAKMLPREGSIDLGTQNVGTPLYMAPEQFSADGRIGAPTDIYALGMIAYMALVGSHYWTDEHRRSENPFAFSRLVSDGPLDSATSRATEHGVILPPAFDDWFRRATARDPGDRYETATEAITELALALDVAAPLMEPDEVTGPGSPFDDDVEQAAEEPFGDHVGTIPASTSSSAKRGITVRDVDATEASLSVTSGSRSSRRAPRKLALPIIAAAVVLSTGIVIFAVRRSGQGPQTPISAAAPAAKPADGTAKASPARSAEPEVVTPGQLPLEAQAQIVDSGASRAQAPENTAKQVQPPPKPRVPKASVGSERERIRLYKRVD
jgi:serine/threonine-protein kinase